MKLFLCTLITAEDTTRAKKKRNEEICVLLEQNILLSICIYVHRLFNLVTSFDVTLYDSLKTLAREKKGLILYYRIFHIKK